ncbi:MAG: repressor LexA [Nitrospinae bacterium CG11_big_fil_rev_8_21_14_0_20_56_8]|nr:MAG: repressor LexA [Nitrospinae bacterium CG11_big_fil_rev_8_21_14_0_20_56_8]
MFLTKRQREIYQFLKEHIQGKGYAPSIVEIGRKFKLNSPATVHKHLTHLESKGLIRKQHNLSRAIEIVDEPEAALAREFPLLGNIAAGKPIEAVEDRETVTLLPDPLDRDVFVLRVKGESMIEDHIRDGDYVIVERRSDAQNGETVVALLDNERATLKRFYRDKGTIRLQPANPAMEPLIVKEGDIKVQGVVIGVLRKFR